MDDSFDSYFNSWVGEDPKLEEESEDEDDSNNELENLSDEELLNWLKTLHEQDYSLKEPPKEEYKENEENFNTFMEPLKQLAIKEIQEEIRRREFKREYNAE